MPALLRAADQDHTDALPRRSELAVAGRERQAEAHGQLQIGGVIARELMLAREAHRLVQGTEPHRKGSGHLIRRADFSAGKRRKLFHDNAAR